MQFMHHHHISRRLSQLLGWGAAVAVVFLLFAIPSHPEWEGSIGFLIQNPLGMWLNLIVLATIGLYALHHSFMPSAPRYRGFFVAGALVAGLVANGLYDQKLSHTASYYNGTGGVQFFAFAVLSYALYRLCMCLPPASRTWLTALYAALLGVFLLQEASYATQVLSGACGTMDALSVWGEMYMECG